MSGSPLSPYNGLGLRKQRPAGQLEADCSPSAAAAGPADADQENALEQDKKRPKVADLLALAVALSPGSAVDFRYNLSIATGFGARYADADSSALKLFGPEAPPRPPVDVDTNFLGQDFGVSEPMKVRARKFGDRSAVLLLVKDDAVVLKFLEATAVHGNISVEHARLLYEPATYKRSLAAARKSCVVGGPARSNPFAALGTTAIALKQDDSVGLALAGDGEAEDIQLTLLCQVRDGLREAAPQTLGTLGERMRALLNLLEHAHRVVRVHVRRGTEWHVAGEAGPRLESPVEEARLGELEWRRVRVYDRGSTGSPHWPIMAAATAAQMRVSFAMPWLIACCCDGDEEICLPVLLLVMRWGLFEVHLNKTRADLTYRSNLDVGHGWGVPGLSHEEWREWREQELDRHRRAEADTAAAAAAAEEEASQLQSDWDKDDALLAKLTKTAPMGQLWGL